MRIFRGGKNETLARDKLEVGNGLGLATFSRAVEAKPLTKTGRVLALLLLSLQELWVDPYSLYLTRLKSNTFHVERLQ
jgi:hypothetical protein